jgi:metal-sulfur cluster biosynthetic enzyme
VPQPRVSLPLSLVGHHRPSEQPTYLRSFAFIRGASRLGSGFSHKVVKVDMSLTSPNCPSAQEVPVMVLNAVSTVPGVGKVDVSVVWDPPWDPSRMSEEARVVLNML